MTDDPIIPQDGQTPGWAANVVDLAEVRVRHGLPRRSAGRCLHKRLTYDHDERRVWCDDCERTIDGFDAFMVLTQHFHAMANEAQRCLERARAAQAAQVHMLAAKKMEKAWRGPNGMAVCCPHCRGGLLPEDFRHGGDCISREIELARRARRDRP